LATVYLPVLSTGTQQKDGAKMNREKSSQCCLQSSLVYHN